MFAIDTVSISGRTCYIRIPLLFDLIDPEKSFMIFQLTIAFLPPYCTAARGEKTFSSPVVIVFSGNCKPCRPEGGAVLCPLEGSVFAIEVAQKKVIEKRRSLEEGRR
jgi:hypothetical protein